MMRNTTFISAFFLLFGCSLFCVAQDKSTVGDSLKLEKLIEATSNEGENSLAKTNELLNQAFTIADSLSKLNPKTSYYLDKKAQILVRQGFFLRKEGNLEEALEMFSQYFEVKKRLDKDEDLDAKLRDDMERSMDSIRIASERKILKIEKQKKANTVFWALLSGLILMLAVSTMTYYRSEEKEKEQAYKNLLLNNKVATKEEEINKLLAETIQHIRSKERIAENLQKLSKEEEGITLKSIIADINASKTDDTKLMLVKQNIEQVNYEFIKTLKSTHPDLSKTDIEICSFIRIGLDRNEISKLRNTSIEAVRKSRHRIRKKMNLEDHIDLYTYLTEKVFSKNSKK